MPIIIQSGRFGAAAAFDPLSLSPSLWFDPSDSATVTIATGVSQIDDKSGNTRHATQGTGTKQPSLASAAINGRDAMLFDGTDDVLNIASFSWTNSTIFQVVKQAALTNNKTAFGNGQGGGTLSLGVSTAAFRAFLGNNASQVTGYDTNVHVIIGRFQPNGASGGSIQVDAGTPSVTTHTSLTGATVSAIGAIVPVESQWWNGHIGETIVYPSLITSGEITSVLNYLKARWGTP